MKRIVFWRLNENSLDVGQGCDFGINPRGQDLESVMAGRAARYQAKLKAKKRKERDDKPASRCHLGDEKFVEEVIGFNK